MKRLFTSIIPKSYRRRAVGVAVTIFVRALLNFVGIALFVPVLVVILDRESITKEGYFSAIYDGLGFSSYTSFAITISLGVVAVIILKNIIALLLYRSERNFTYGLYKHLSERLYIGYHNRGLGFIKHSNSALLTRNVNVVSLMFVVGVIKPIATIIGEIMLFALLFVAMMCYSPIAALLAVAVIIPVILLFYFVVRRKLNDIGIRENEAQRTKSRIVAETFRGYSDIEIGGAFPEMYDRFESAMDEVVALRKRNATIGMLPQMFTETGMALGMAALVILSVVVSTTDIGLLFGIFAVAVMRLIPSIRNIMSSWSALRYNRYTIDVVAEATDENINIDRTIDRFHFSKEIELDDLSFKFDDADTETISNLSLKISKGERVGIKGASGVGKTTLFNLMLGLYAPTSGKILVDNEELNKDNIRKWQNSIGYVSQSVFIADMSLAENVALGTATDKIDFERVTRVLEMADLKEFVASLAEGIHSRIGEQGSRLSGGQRQRIGIARALYKECDILFFDEATSSLDSHTEENINSAIRRLSADNRALTIVVIAHRDSSLEYCDRIIDL